MFKELEIKNTNEDLIDKKELSKKLCLSVSMIDKLMTKGLPRYEIGRRVRFKFTEVMKFLEKGRYP